MAAKKEGKRKINRVEIAGKIVQISRKPGNAHYDWGVLDYAEDTRYPKEVILLFPGDLYFQEDIVGKYMAIQGVIGQDDEGETVVGVEAMVPCTARRTQCKYKPEWWEGPMEIPGFSSYETQEDREEQPKVVTF